MSNKSPEESHSTSFPNNGQGEGPDFESITMSAQQRELAGKTTGSFRKYREFTVGDAGTLSFLGFELYQLFASGLAGALGLAGRRLLLPPFLHSGGRGNAIGRSVTLRQPNQISLGKGCIIDDFAVIDIRNSKGREDHATKPAIELGDHVLIGRFSIVVAKSGSIRIGAGSNVGTNCRIATQSRIDIGRGVLIAAYAYVGPGNHRTDRHDVPLIEQGMDIRGGVTIGDNCWIGARATILDGVTIGANAIVGAHSLVRENVPEGAIVAGTPAKIIRYRDPEQDSQ